MNLQNQNPYYRLCLIVLFGIFCLLVGKRVSGTVPDIMYGCILGYYFVGLSSAIVHWFLDTYDTELFKEGHVIFKMHHENPLSMEESPWFVTMTDTIILALFIGGIIYGVLLYFRATNGVVWSMIFSALWFTLLTQVVHRWSHRRKHGIYVPSTIKHLQDFGVILHPSVHSQHHEKETVHYGIFHSNTDMLFQFIMFTVLGFRSSTHLDQNKRRREPPVTKVQVARELTPLLLLSIVFMVLKKIG